MKKSTLYSLRKFIPYYRPYIGTFIFDMTCSLGVAASDLVFPILVRLLLNTGLNSPDGMHIDVIIRISIYILIIKLFDALCNYYVNTKGHVMGAKMEKDMRNELFAKYEQLSFSYYDNTKIGQLMSRITNDLFEVTEFAHHCPEMILTAGIKIIGGFIILSNISIWVTLIIFALFPIMFIFSIVYNRKMREAFKKQREQIGTINAGVEDSLAGIRVIKSFSNEDYEMEQFEKDNNKFLDIKRETYKYMGIFQSGIRFFNGMMYLAVVLVGSLFIVNNVINVVDLVAYLLYINTLLSSITQLVQFTEQLQRGMTGFHRFVEVMETPLDITDKDDAVELGNVDGKISFNDVSFKYGENLKEVLNHINIDVQPGETVAIVGPSGSGKSTICNLIPRFYDIRSGSITIDGTDIRDVTQRSLRKNIGMVQQDVYLFAGTIKENIAYGNFDASFEDIVKAAKQAGADEFITQLENGYDTYVGERGVKLSGGQKQRISIARVFLKNPPILILDEATSSLDNESEKIVQQSLERLSQGRTTLIIAHRLTTIRNATKIIVLTEKGIEEVGTHKELIEKKGLYSSLYELYSTL